MAKDVDGYLSFYAKDFAPSRSTSAKWIAERRRLVSKTGTIELTGSRGGPVLRHVVNILGRTRLCTPALPLPGVPRC